MTTEPDYPDGRILWRHPDGELREAPFNGGAGGYFSPADEETTEFAQIAAEQAQQDLSANEYWWFNADYLLSPLTTVTGGDRRFQQNSLQIRIDNHWVTLEVPQLEVPEINALVTDKGLVFGYTSGPGPLPVWLGEGGRDAWLSKRAQTKAERAGRKKVGEARMLAEELRARHDSGDYFINPYTFVPLPETVVQGAPRGHAGLGTDGLSGSFIWRLTFQTPLVFPKDALPTTGGIFKYPGSALRGALRSVHEAMVGGCLRVVDPDYTPVHREPMSTGTLTHTLAVVRKVDPVTGAVIEVETTDNLTWIELPVVNRALSAPTLYSGALVDVDVGEAVCNRHTARKEITAAGAVTAGNSWVLHLSATFRERDKHPYFVAAGRLTGHTKTISPAVWKEFVQVCAGAEDLIGVTTPPNTTGLAPGSTGWPGEDVIRYKDTPRAAVIGQRRRVDGHLSVGDTVWIGPGGRLKMATIWRYPGERPVRDRMPAELRPCHDPINLCPSCAVFGSVDQRPITDSKPALIDQAGYSSHIRVDWASSNADYALDSVNLPPLRSPKPSSGGFYLMIASDADNRASKDPKHKPLAHWGSAQDRPARMIRGRKYYWHGQDPEGRQQVRPHQLPPADEIENEQVTVASGLVLETRVTFDNLDGLQLGWLLAAAAPSLFFDHDCCIHIGGGKPLGFGSAIPEICELQISTGVDRYSGGHPVASTPAQLVQDARDQTPEHLRSVHGALERVLAASPEGVPADRLWYPTTGNFTTRNTDEEFDWAFKWFAHHSGGRPAPKQKFSGERKGAAGDLVPLPDVMSDDQYIQNLVPFDERGGNL